MLFVAVFVFSEMSGGLPVMSVGIALLAGAVLSLCLAVWVKGSIGERLSNVASLAFSLAAAGFLAGYAYEIIYTYIVYN